MGFNVTKRVSDLRKQADRGKSGRWGVLRSTLVSFIFLAIFTFLLLPKSKPISSASPDEELSAAQRHQIWQKELNRQFTERMEWLDHSFLTLMPGAADMYYSFGQSIVSSIQQSAPQRKAEDELFNVDSVGVWINRSAATVMLRVGFVLIAFWPFWALSLCLGLGTVLLSRRKRTKMSSNILTVLDPQNGPFYSGIWGKFSLNNSFSGTDVSCPSLACPALEKRSVALAHPLCVMLKKHDALSETTITLVQTILAHKHFPSIVGEEVPVQPEEQDAKTVQPEERRSETGFVTVEDGLTLLKGATEGLAGVLEAHRRIVHYRQMLEKKKIKISALNKNYPAHAANVEKIAASVSPLAGDLVRVMTPNRMWAFGKLPPKLVAAAYLAIEAGKALVFQQHGAKFTLRSNYPHLQARAVIQSIPAYHEEFDGDARVIIRQAIICSRRHGDFGRAFLPNRMPIESRALRDWLEILYSAPAQRKTTQELVELDSHIEELGVNWRLGFADIVKRDIKKKQNQVDVSKGLPFKSVLLMPLQTVVETALRGIHPLRLQRIADLLPITSRYQAHLSISARLPGFKRQAMEAERSSESSDAILKSIAADKNGALLIERWRIVRRMLTRYNWLSTRVGDDGVPLAGIIHGVVQPVNNNEMPSNESNANTIALKGLVPIRQRRLVELFGRKWESQFYEHTPHMDTITVFVDEDSFKEELASKPKAEGTPEMTKSVASG